MDFYRCFFLDDADAVFGRTEFHAATDEEAKERAARHTQMNAHARGYSLWQSGRLVVERAAGEVGTNWLPGYGARPVNS